MLNPELKLNNDLFQTDVPLKSCRDGFGEAIFELGGINDKVFVLAADLSDSVKVTNFARKYPKRFIQTGISEQNMTGIAAGLALSGKTPVIASHAIFNPSRNWDQIRLSICLSNLGVVIAGSHAGLSNSPDGSVAESLEDIALMRVLPNMTILSPIDYWETRKCIFEAIKLGSPVYIRFSKAETPLITKEKTPFQIGKSQTLVKGEDVTLISTGPITYQALLVAKNMMAKNKISVEVISATTLKPLDEKAIIASAKKTGKVVVLEEHQIIGGLGSAVCEVLSTKNPTPVMRIGMENTFGESGSYKDILNKYKLSFHHIESKIEDFLHE